MSLTLRNIEINFPHWTTGQCSAYHAGAKAGIREKTIREGYEYPADEEDDEDLTLYFFRGYADAVGDDARSQEWFEEISDWVIQDTWWLN